MDSILLMCTQYVVKEQAPSIVVATNDSGDTVQDICTCTLVVATSLICRHMYTAFPTAVTNLEDAHG